MGKIFEGKCEPLDDFKVGILLTTSVDQEKALTIVQMDKVFNKLWNAGVREVIFIAHTIDDDLVRLVKCARKFVTGIIANDAKVTPEQAIGLREGDLDWIEISLDSVERKIPRDVVNGINTIVAAGLHVSVNCTLRHENETELKELVDIAKSLGIEIINATVSSEIEIRDLLEGARKYAETKDIIFDWCLPTCPVSMSIEPDGDMVAYRNPAYILGNILTDDWNNIWTNWKRLKMTEHECNPDIELL